MSPIGSFLVDRHLSNPLDDASAGAVPFYDGLYDLACHLAGDERRAEELLCSAVRPPRVHPAGGYGGRVEDPRGRLVRAYLSQNDLPSRRPGWLTSRLRKRGSGPAKTAPAGKADLDKLNPRERACLILRERLGLSVAEIARLTGLGPTHTRGALFSARERLRASGARQGDR